MAQEIQSEGDQYASVLAALQRIVDSGVLGERSRLRRLLTYIVTEELDGRGERLKAYSIGIEALERSDDFDPNADSIVRVEVNRLRQSLQHFYASSGQSDPIRIEIPKGRYRPVISRSEVAPEPQSPAVGSGNLRMAVLVFFAVVIGVSAIWWISRDEVENDPWNEMSGMPVLEVRSFQRADPDGPYSLIDGVREQLIVDLAHLGTVQVRDFSVQIDAESTLKPPQYIMTGNAPPTSGQAFLLLKLADSASGNIVWSRRLTLPKSDADFYGLLRDTVGALAVELAGERGVVPTDVLRRFDTRLVNLGKSDTTEYECLLRAFTYDNTKDPEAKAAARLCLDELIDAESANSSIWAEYALMEFLDWAKSGSAGGSARALETALSAARRAVQLDPSNAIAHEHLGSILSASGGRDEAISAYRRALQLAPSKPSLHFLLGWQIVLSGDWETGMTSVKRGVDMSPFAPGYMRIPLALDAFRRQDYRRSLDLSVAIMQLGDPRGLSLAFGAAIGLGDDDRARQYLADLKKRANFDPSDPFREVRNSFSNPSVMEIYDSLVMESGIM